MFGFGSRDLKDALRETKKLKLHGVLFEIKKLSPVNYLTGSNTLIEVFSVHSNDKSNNTIGPNYEKIKKHFKDVFIEAVVKPKLDRKESPEGVCVDEVFENWDLANDLYVEIMTFTYGKKKTQKHFLERGLSKLTQSRSDMAGSPPNY